MNGQNGATPTSSSAFTFTCSAASMDKLAVVYVTKDTIVKLPARVQLATVDGKAIVLELSK